MAGERLSDAARLAQQAGDHWVQAEALFIGGDRERTRGRLDRAAELYRQSIALLRSIEDEALIAYPIGNLGRIAIARGDDDAAQAHFEEALLISRGDGNRLGLADWQLQLGALAVRRGETGRAMPALAEALSMFNAVGNLEGVADALVQCATLALASNDASRAASLLGAADRMLETHNRLHQVVEVPAGMAYKHQVLAARAALEPDAFANAWAVGRAMSTANAIACAIG